MKWIKYQIRTEANWGTEEEPDIHYSFHNVAVSYSVASEELVKKEAWEGKYTIEDDGEPDPPPTQMDRLEAQATYTALMTDTLLEEET